MVVRMHREIVGGAISGGRSRRSKNGGWGGRAQARLTYAARAAKATWVVLRSPGGQLARPASGSCGSDPQDHSDVMTRE